MDKKEAKRKFITYLKERNIKFCEHLADGESCIYMLLTGYKKCPDEVLECSVFFFDCCMEARVYFNGNAAKWISEKADDLSDMYRLLNYCYVA